MKFLNRTRELERLEQLTRAEEGRLAVIYGRRRVGKTRLLLEWTERHGGLYTVADQSAPDVQRRYFAGALSARLPGFGDVAYPDWASLFERLGRDALAAGFDGPLVIDELPYLALGAPELASVLQRFVDHAARRASLKLALAGSSQRMMQGLVLSAAAPLYGRAHALLELGPLSASELVHAFGRRPVHELVLLHAAWGGIPRYWELARDASPTVEEQIDALVLDPLGPLHTEPDRLLLEELPPALELRPILDAVGQGAHRVSEIAGRLGAQATSLSRPLLRLQELGLLRREVPYGEPQHKSKRSVYELDDPFVRLWFRVVAPHRARLVSSKRRERLELLRNYLPALAAVAWEDLCRARLPELDQRTVLAQAGPFQRGQRWWHGNAPEWDLVSESENGQRILVGEIKWSAKPFSQREIDHLVRETAHKPLPPAAAKLAAARVLRAVFVPELAAGVPRQRDGVHIVPGSALLPG